MQKCSLLRGKGHVGEWSQSFPETKVEELHEDHKWPCEQASMPWRKKLKLVKNSRRTIRLLGKEEHSEKQLSHQAKQWKKSRDDAPHDKMNLNMAVSRSVVEVLP